MSDTQIKVDTGLLREYASRLKKVNSRLKALEGDLEALYRREGLVDIGAILRSGDIGWSKTIDSAATYLLETAEDFENVEKEICDMLDRSMQGEHPFAYFDDGEQSDVMQPARHSPMDPLTIAGGLSQLDGNEYFSGDYTDEQMPATGSTVLIGEGISLCINSDDIILNDISLRTVASYFGLGFVELFKGQWSQVQALVENYSLSEQLKNLIPGYSLYSAGKAVVNSAIDTYNSFKELFTAKDPYDFAYHYGRICAEGVEDIAFLAATEGAGKIIEGAAKGSATGIKAADGVFKKSPLEMAGSETESVQNAGKSITETSEVLGSIISQSDRLKISGWKYIPDDELYLKYKGVFDNPKYYNQITGEVIWPYNDGFSHTPTDEFLKPGTRIDRYGYDSGSFASPESTPYEMRALAPGTDAKPYSIFEVVEPIEVQMGEIAAWFDEPGGGIQYILPDSVDELLVARKIRRIR